MYFLAHMYFILESIHEMKLSLDGVLDSLIFGCWAPDAGYFPFYSANMKKFYHANNPTINLFSNSSEKAKWFEIGWKCHLACDDLIHHESFFRNNEPLCPPIIRDNGTKIYLETTKIHLTREVSLDILLFTSMDKNSKTAKALFSESTYKKNKVTFPGFYKLQNYVYTYTNRFLPIAASKGSLGALIKNIFDFGFYNLKSLEKNIENFNNKAKLICEKVIEKNIIK